MKIAIPTETQHGESRVAASPDTVKAFIKKGADVAVEASAGKGASIPDEAFAAAGARIVQGGFGDADVVLTVRRPSGELLSSLKRGTLLIGGLEPYGDKAGLDAIAAAGVTAFAMELMPRITRAQSMDILSSQANLAGYKAVIDAAFHFTRAFPMMMTAAGTVPAAKVFIMGVGVAGLQAIATARRLGAIVSATDVRKATEEQVKSLGAKFVYADIADAATSGGYARELSAEDKARQAALVANHVKTQDVIITTALIPGRPAPVLITQEMVESMKPGSIIVDLAVERGGNCPLSKPDQIVEHKGVKIVGTVNLAGKLAGNAAPLFARNLANFLDLMIQKDGSLKIDDADECIRGTMIARDGALVHPMFGA
ncbi:Re/Si-specific NAD(P)(+) transhydrogenase subunit alpha [Aestuariivirga sp.]|uniref:Re/Si-specific NAD(P)(+) transhydrogenase subunit alpha n=1 Tax=Aestuariivirga sp. TaxID=2650926 RepID=UPI0025C2E632|nr:Re/Si-specific NAD(P)(+) transhydrogenase subunit alpha [Aestuariivirga sp.]MCA3555017.1 Re/Si-specific NAD(P)(+) transhydrogenase subunit alpha [Aestuariivirga sp.]